MSQRPVRNAKKGPESAAETGDGSQADWGFDGGDSSRGSERRLAIVLVICLVGVFGLLVYQKFAALKRAPSVAAPGSAAAADGTTSAARAEADEASRVITPTPSRAEPQPTLALLEVEPAAVQPGGFDPFATAQSEPTPPSTTEGTGDTHSDVGTTAAMVADATWTIEPASAQATPADDFNPFGPTPQDEAGSAPASDPFLQADATPAEKPTPTPTPSPTRTAAPVSDPGDLDETAPAGNPFFIDDRPSSPASTSGPASLAGSANLTSPAMPSALASPEPLDGFALEGSASVRETSPAFEPTLPSQSEPQPLAESDRTVAVSDEAVKPDPFAAASPSRATETQASSIPALEFPHSPEGVGGGHAADPSQDWPVASPADAPPSSGEPVSGGGWDLSPSSQGVPETSFGSGPSRLEHEPAGPQPPSFEGLELSLDPAPAPVPVAGGASPASPASSEPFPQSASRLASTGPMIGEEAVFGERLHVISANDSLWSICQAEYGSARYTTALGRYNRDRIPHADKLVLGATLRIPPPEVLESTFPELFQVRPHRDGLVAPAGGGGDAGVGSEPAAGLFVTPAGERRYRVGRNETLTSIAAQVLGRGSRWIELYNLNRDQLATPESLKIGMELKLPPAASRVGVAPAPSLSR